MSNIDKIVINLFLTETVTNQITVLSAAFENNELIPDVNSAYYDNVSPSLAWSNVPTAAKSLVLIVQDPDAPKPEPFVHWMIVNLPPDATGLPENQPPTKHLEADLGKAQQGINGFGALGYLGPKPPPGHGVHHYHFQVLALDVPEIKLNDDFTIAELTAAISDHIVAAGELVGTYERKAD